ncbi:MAG: tRNA (5-methylaminomethyl-2-thiouridylate)-methyltransferase [Parcubacteria group bacterium Gr01-1014_17]|nr:MAG: tRNA (5-methylaminomethyl-2-thiouridylate)-methyltransferase [Parcubacteria group bacterium Gr01-1014_17]
MRIFVGLSGGVDSSVSAALLKEAGHEVTGVFIRVWDPFTNSPSTSSGQLQGTCNWKDDRLDAMRVCATLGIPFKELNLEKEYKKEVVDYMIREYKAGRTPNPDVSCNRFIKFGGFYKLARKQGADFIATGHYARILPFGEGRVGLFAGRDTNKDQSYFLWQIKREQLPHILFPVGGMKKPEVRKHAKKLGLITADKKDSQGLCFIGKVDMKEFLSHYIKPKKWRVLDENGTVLGEHEGAAFYTIGERLCGGYVTAKDMRKNTLTISQKNTAGELPNAKSEITITNCNWVSGISIMGKTYQAQTRYRAPLVPCHIFNGHPMSIKKVVFEKPQTIASGQSLVLYDGEVCIGGGVMI